MSVGRRSILTHEAVKVRESIGTATQLVGAIRNSGRIDSSMYSHGQVYFVRHLRVFNTKYFEFVSKACKINDSMELNQE